MGRALWFGRGGRATQLSPRARGTCRRRRPRTGMEVYEVRHGAGKPEDEKSDRFGSPYSRQTISRGHLRPHGLSDLANQL